MKPYDLVFIDADETLLDFRKAERHALLNAFGQYGVESTEEIALAYEEINAAIWKRLEKGEIDQERLKVERFRMLFEALGVDIDPVAFSSLYLEALGKGAFLLSGAEEICDYLAGKYRLAMVTNGIKEVQRARIGASPIAAYFAALVISEEAGSSKPNPAIFEYACGLLDARDKGKMIMIGDSLSSDIRGGISFGIDTCWFNPSGAPNPTELRPTYEICKLEELKRIL
jgi:YjjG family noncanonical pyrimidine nucleotidase